ncbi:hypothetical protein ACHAW5_008392 [Stephanodiscus triporus]|uniref:Uncharacterized protein n=1 Tax=Stephanodiscus triporus TaxID=2934178 RepID=A0ABD3N8A1_9STRA
MRNAAFRSMTAIVVASIATVGRTASAAPSYSTWTTTTASGSGSGSSGLLRPSSSSSSFVVLAMPRGGASSSDYYDARVDAAKKRAIEGAYVKIEEARRRIVDECTPVTNFGSKADEIYTTAIEEYARSVAEEGGGSSSSSSPSSSSSSSSYERGLRELEAALDAPLEVLYLRQLALHRDAALASYRSSSSRTTSDGSDYESMLIADAAFVRLAESSTPRRTSTTSFTYENERDSLRSAMNDVASISRKLIDVQVKSSSQQGTAMQFLQQQQQMIQQLQQQLYGQNSPWNVGVAYRIPDTNFNLQGSYQSGRANFQLSCVPDEYAPMLGPNGFTNGVGPGNLGLSLNLSI